MTTIRRMGLWGAVLVLILASGCVYTLDPHALTVDPTPHPGDENSPRGDSGSSASYVPVQLDDSNSVRSHVPDSNTVQPHPPVVQPPVQTITLSANEVAAHKKRTDCWMIIHGNVYNLTSFANHPGGSVYVPYCGRDGSSAFDAQGHSSVAAAMLKSFYLGSLNATVPASSVNG